MGRFDRQEPSSDREKNFDAVAQKLRSTVEGRVRGVVEAAVARGLAIEERARINARKIEEESDRKSREMLAGSLDAASETVDLLLRQADGVLRATESMHVELGRLIESFRSEVEPLRENLRATKDMLAGTAGAPPPETEEEPGAEQQPVADEEPVTEAQAPVEPSPPERPDDGSRDKVRRQLIRLHESGKRRADVARYLARFESSDYEDMLDEIFGPEPPPAPESEIKPPRPDPVAAEEQPAAPAAEAAIEPEPATDAEAPEEPAPAEEPDAATPSAVSPSAAPGDDRGRE